MNKELRANWMQFTSLFEFTKKYESKLTGSAMFTEIMAKATPHYSKVLELLPLLERDIKEETEQKAKLGAELAHSCFCTGNCLHTYGVLKNFEAFLSIPKDSQAKYRRMSGLKLIPRSQFIHGVWVANPEEATLAGCTEEAQTAFAELIEKYILIVNNPQNARSARKENLELIEREFKMLTAWLKDLLHPHMMSNYQMQDPDLYTEFLISSSKEGVGHIRRQLTGSLKNAHTKEPLQMVSISIDGENIYKRGGKKGLYYFQHMEAGEHTLRFELKGYEAQEKRINILSGTPYQLDVELKPINVN